MSGKNLRVTQADQRTNAEGKQVSNKVLLAMPANEYELMRSDLTYMDLPHHLSLHEPTQKIEFVYFPNRGMVSQVVVTKDGRTVEVGVVGNEGYVGAGLAAGLGILFGIERPQPVLVISVRLFDAGRSAAISLVAGRAPKFVRIVNL